MKLKYLNELGLDLISHVNLKFHWNVTSFINVCSPKGRSWLLTIESLQFLLHFVLYNIEIVNAYSKRSN